MTSFTIPEIRSALDSLESSKTLISLEDIKKELSYAPVVASIVNMIKALSEGYISPLLRETVAEQMCSEHYIEEVIPSIRLGRRRGHSTAIAKYIQSNPNESIMVVVPSVYMIDEYRTMLSIPIRRGSTKSSTYSYNQNVTFITQVAFKNSISKSSFYNQDPLIIVECAVFSKAFLNSLDPEILQQRIITVGN